MVQDVHPEDQAGLLEAKSKESAVGAETGADIAPFVLRYITSDKISYVK